MSTTIASVGKSSEITEAQWPNSRRRGSPMSDFYPLFCRLRTKSPEGFGQRVDEISGHQRLLSSGFLSNIAC
jgi:hypothetical protein